MNVVNMLKKKVVQKILVAGAAVMSMGFAGNALAAGGTYVTVVTLSGLQSNIASTSGLVLKIIMTLITLAGVILVIKGIVHLKQNYTGTGQEKHLSKGLACLGFGAALFIAVPITHVLIGGLVGSGTGASGYNNWTSVDTAQNIGS